MGTHRVPLQKAHWLGLDDRVGYINCSIVLALYATCLTAIGELHPLPQ